MRRLLVLRFSLFAALVVWFAGAIVPAIAASESAPALLIRNVTIVSPEREQPYGPVDVRIERDRIAEIGKELSVEGIGHENVLDGTERFLAPGLIDGHVHLAGVPGMHGGHEHAYPEIANAARAQMPRSFLYFGFTSVVELIGESQGITAWNAQETRPRAYFCGAAPVFDGYPTNYAPKPQRYYENPNFLYDPARAESFPEGFDPAEHSAEAVVARIAADGAVAVKLFYEDGFGAANDIPVPSLELLRTVVVAAHELGLPVILHATSQNAQSIGVEAGVDGFAHGMWTWDSPDASELTAPITDILDNVLAQGIAVQSTIQTLCGERDLFDPDYLTRPDVRHAVPQVVLDWYASPDGQWFAAALRKNPYVANAEAAGRWQGIDEMPIRHVTQAMAYLSARGAKLLFGSDTPSAPTYANPTGLNGRLEMDRLVTAGVTPRAILHAATLGNAEFFGLADEIGSVEVGKRADLLLLGANPLESLTAYDTLEVVISEGRAIDRAMLAADYAER